MTHYDAFIKITLQIELLFVSEYRTFQKTMYMMVFIKTWNPACFIFYDFSVLKKLMKVQQRDYDFKKTVDNNLLFFYVFIERRKENIFFYSGAIMEI